MRQIKFETKHRGGIWEYHFCPKGEVFSTGLSDHHSIYEALLRKAKGEIYYYDFYEKYNISLDINSEKRLLYMLLVWQLTKNNRLLGVGSRESEQIEHGLKKTPSFINWEYILEHKSTTEENDTLKNIGFQTPISPFNRSKLDKSPLKKSGLFEIESFNELVNFFEPASDVFKLVNLYATSRPDAIVDKLQKDEKPDIKTLMINEDIFIGLLIGDEPGYLDYLLIKSKQELKNLLDPILEKINGFAKEYQTNIQNIKNLNEITQLIELNLEKYDLEH